MSVAINSNYYAGYAMNSANKFKNVSDYSKYLTMDVIFESRNSLLIRIRPSVYLCKHCFCFPSLLNKNPPAPSQSPDIFSFPPIISPDNSHKVYHPNL